MHFRKPVLISAIALAATLAAQADFSYTTTSRATGGSMAAMAGAAMNQTATTYVKGDKYASVGGAISTVIDFGAQTITTINNTAKTYAVKKFSDLGANGAAINDATADVKETGQKKNINGFNCSEVLLTMGMDMTMGRGAPTMKMQLEVHMWVSPDVPGAGNLRDFYKKNANSFPWAALASAQGGTGNESVQKALSTMQRKMADMDGAPVEQVVVVKSADMGAQMGQTPAQMPAMPQMTPQQQAQMQAAMAKMQQMQAAGGAQAAAAQQAMAAMGNMGRGPAAAGANSSNGSLIEITMDESKFSSDSVPDSVFAIPAGYKQQ